MSEATIICCDCSEYMRNGDFYPSRFMGQSDAVQLITNAKIRQNQENSVGLIEMHPNAKANVLVNCTQDIDRVLSSLQKMNIVDNSNSDSIDILITLKTARLALKHRNNKKQNQRIILFIGSPITNVHSQKLLMKAAERLKKNNISIDIVNFGEINANTHLLQRFINTVNGTNDNSNLVTVESGKLLCDVLVSTPIICEQNKCDDYAFNEENNGDLAMALRLSMEEERERQQTQANKTAKEIDMTDGLGIDEEDKELLKALQMSMEQNNNDDEFVDGLLNDLEEDDMNDEDKDNENGDDN